MTEIRSLPTPEIIEVRRHALRIVRQCTRHADQADTAARELLAAPPRGTVVYGDYEAAQADQLIANLLRQNAEQLASVSYGLQTCLASLEMHLEHETVLMAPMAVVARSVLEQAATAAWVLDSSVDTKERAARSAASLFRAIQLTMRDSASIDPGTASPDRRARAALIADIEGAGGQVYWRKDQKTGETLDEVAKVAVGGRSAAVNYNATQRIQKYVHDLDWAYSMLSGVTHGEQLALHAAADAPVTYLAAVAATAWRSTEAWANAIFSYVGMEAGEFVNTGDLNAIADAIADGRRGVK